MRLFSFSKIWENAVLFTLEISRFSIQTGIFGQIENNLVEPSSSGESRWCAEVTSKFKLEIQMFLLIVYFMSQTDP